MRPPPVYSYDPNNRRHTFCGPTEGDNETKGEGSTECLDSGRHVEAHQYESLCAPRSCAISVTHLAPLPGDKCELECGLAVEGRGGGQRDRGDPDLRTPPSKKEPWHRMTGCYKAVDDRAAS